MLKELLEIANSIEPGIEMELGVGDNHQSGKLPILDMEVWLTSDGDAVYQHYEKKVASKLVISSRSAHSSNSKRSTLISENEYFVPIMNDYMIRMKQAGYSESYRKNVLLSALAVYDKKVNDDNSGVMPMNRPTGYMKIERRKQKKQKKKEWGTKGGYCALIIVPSTPNSELAKKMREVAENFAECGVRFKVVEKGGVTLGRMLQRPNPLASGSCSKPDCIMCDQQYGIKTRPRDQRLQTVLNILTD